MTQAPPSHRPIRTFDLARRVAPSAAALLELHRRFCAEEQRLTVALGADEPPTFEDFVEWVVARSGRPPGRPHGSRDRHPDAKRRRVEAWRRRRAAGEPHGQLAEVA